MTFLEEIRSEASDNVRLARFMNGLYQDIDTIVALAEPLFLDEQLEEDVRSGLGNLVPLLQPAWDQVLARRQELIGTILDLSRPTSVEAALFGAMLELKLAAWLSHYGARSMNSIGKTRPLRSRV